MKVVFTRILPRERSGYTEPPQEKIEVFADEEDEEEKHTSSTDNTATNATAQPAVSPPLRYRLVV